MKKYLFLFLAGLVSVSLADDLAWRANQQYYAVRERAEVMLDQAQGCLAREAAFKDLADRLTNRPDNLLGVIEDAYLELLAREPAFLLSRFAENPAAFEAWLNHLDLRWTGQGASPYPAWRRQALDRLPLLKRRLQRQLDMLQRLTQHLEKTRPGELR